MQFSDGGGAGRWRGRMDKTRTDKPRRRDKKKEEEAAASNANKDTGVSNPNKGTAGKQARKE